MSRAEVTPAEVSSLIGYLARTMVVRVSVAEILEDLVGRLVEALPVTGAGVSMIAAEGGPCGFVASGPRAGEFEAVQARLREGPCVTACETRAQCIAPDLTSEARFPQFAREASQAGLAAAFAFPLLYGEQRLGAIDLYRDMPGVLSDEECTAAMMVADVVAACLVNAQERADLELLADRLKVQARRDPLTQLADRNVLSSDVGDWHERLIRGDAAGEVAFSSVLVNRTETELVITQYDRRAMMLRRYEWRVDVDAAHVEVTGADWDGQEILRSHVASIPVAPQDLDELDRLFAGLDAGS